MLHSLSERLDGTSAPSTSADVPRAQFSLATLLLMTTLIAACLGVCRLNACLGTFTVLLAAPALLRTLYLGAAENTRGHRLSVYEKCLAFLASLDVMMVSYAAGLLALVVSWPITFGLAAGLTALLDVNGDPLFSLSWLISSCCGLAAAVWSVWSLRPRRR
jgi:hypothetical protein